MFIHYFGIMKNRLLLVLFTLATLMSCEEKKNDERPVKGGEGGEDGYFATKYQNPVIRNNAADPYVLDDRENTGYFYAYSTQNGTSGDAKCVYLPVYKSTDMVNWELVGNAFGGMQRPQWVPDTRIWAPEVEYIDGRYCLYYAEGHWNTPSLSAVGVAVSDSPTGPFTWTNLKSIQPLADTNGMLVDYKTTGVTNSIDPDVIRDEKTGDLYLFWGSFGASEGGIHAIKLTDDGLAIAPGATKTYIAFECEGTYVHYKNGYYYFFGSKGSCCEGVKSTYHVVVARSQNILGPYVGKDGKEIRTKSTAFDNETNTILRGPSSGYFAGTGHNAGIITDDKGKDWMCYHAFWSGNKYDGRCMSLDEIVWGDGWPSFKTGFPSEGKVDGPTWKETGKTKSLMSTMFIDNFDAEAIVETGDNCSCRNTWELSEEYANNYEIKYNYE